MIEIFYYIYIDTLYINKQVHEIILNKSLNR